MKDFSQSSQEFAQQKMGGMRMEVRKLRGPLIVYARRLRDCAQIP
jgi:hypothetical protein